ncbi:hypothetical protein D3C71_1292580 [compost metagenome]
MANGGTTVRFINAIDVIDFQVVFPRAKGVTRTVKLGSSASSIIFSKNHLHPFRLFQIREWLAFGPGEGRAVFQSSFFQRFGFFKGRWMSLAQADPFDFLLEKAKGAATSTAPFIILGETDARGLQYLQDPRFVDTIIAKRQQDFQVFVFRCIPFSIIFIGTDRDVRKDFLASGQHRSCPFFKWGQLQLASTPACLCRR